MTLTVGGLFSGIAGFEEGFRRAGFSHRWSVEIDHDCRRVLAHHYPDTPCFEDVRQCGKANLEPVDVICGGFPCQGLSVAGQRGGLSDSRSGLFFEMSRIVRELRPSLLIWENVPGLLSGKDEESICECETPDPDTASQAICRLCGLPWTDMGEPASRPVPWMGTVLRELSDSGLVGAWRVVDSQFYGVPQRRRRVFGCFACLHPRNRIRLPGAASWGDPHRLARLCAEILALTDRSTGHPAKGRKKGKDVAGTLGGGSNKRGWCDDLDRNGAFITGTMSSNGDAHSGFRLGDGLAVAFAQNCRDEVRDLNDCAGACAAQPGMKQQTFVVTNDSTPIAGTDCVPTRSVGTGLDIQSAPAVVYSPDLARCVATREGSSQDYESTTMIAHCIKGAAIGRSPAAGPQRGFVAEDKTFTLNATEAHAVQSGVVVRRLTTVECLRLQGFPDDWLDLAPPLSDSAKYRMCGNAVTMVVGKWLASRGRRVLEGVTP